MTAPYDPASMREAAALLAESHPSFQYGTEIAERIRAIPIASPPEPRTCHGGCAACDGANACPCPCHGWPASPPGVRADAALVGQFAKGSNTAEHRLAVVHVPALLARLAEAERGRDAALAQLAARSETSAPGYTEHD